MYTQKVPHTNQGFMHPTNYASQLAGAAAQTAQPLFRHTTLNTIVLHVRTLTSNIHPQKAGIYTTCIHTYSAWQPSLTLIRYELGHLAIM